MNENADALERLWLEAINPDPGGNWLTEFLARPDKNEHPIADAGKVMERLAQTQVSRLDLGQVVRPERYEMCFQTVCALEDPGVRGKLAGLHLLLPKANPDQARGRIKERALFAVLWEGINGYGDFDGWMENAGKEMIFSDGVAAAQRLLEQGVTKDEIMTLIRWHTYEACYQSLRVLGECFEGSEEVSSLHEVLLGADPSGLEGGPKSWPLPAKAAAKPGVSIQPDPSKPCLKIKGPEDFSFIADGQSFVTWARGGPARIWDVRTGAEQIALHEMKGYNCFAPAPDGTRVAASLKKSLAIFDARTGSKTQEVPWKFPCWVTWEEDGIFVISEETKGSKTNHSFWLRDPETLEVIRELNFPGAGDSLNGLAFSPDNKKLGLSWHAAYGNSRLIIWSWPQTEKLGEWLARGEKWKWSADSKLIGVAPSGLAVHEAHTGQVLHETNLGFGYLAFSPDGQWLVAGTHSSPSDIHIWNLPRWEKVKQFPLESGYCFGLEISSDGRVLGAASHRCCLFWDFPGLVQGL